MLKTPNHMTRTRILDAMYKTVSSICIGITVVSSAYLVYRGYKFLADDMPLINRKQKQELLTEGAHDRDSAKELSTWSASNWANPW